MAALSLDLAVMSVFHWSITEYPWILSCWGIKPLDKNQRHFKLYGPRKFQHFLFFYQCCVLCSTANKDAVSGFIYPWIRDFPDFPVLKYFCLLFPRRILGLSSLDVKHCSMCKGHSQVIIGSIFLLEQEFIFKMACTEEMIVQWKSVFLFS